MSVESYELAPPLRSSATDMEERVARAICVGYVAAIKGSPQKYGWRQFLPLARAAIEAMREPTDAMTAEGGDTPCGQFYPGSQAANIWRNMIDAALTPSPASR